MSIIPEEFLPPREHLPEKIYALPELRLPDRLNIADYCIDRHVRAGRGEQVLIYFKNQKFTYRQMQETINRLANALRKMGIEKNDRVMLRSENNPRIFAAYFACWRIGAIAVLTHHLLRAEEIAFRANDSEAKVMIASVKGFEDVKEARSSFKTVKDIILLDGKEEGCFSYDDLIADQSAEAETADTGKNDLLRIIYSSGTTGKPKGIITSVGDIVCLMESYCLHILNLQPSDIIGGHPAFAFAFGFSLLLFPGFKGSSVSLVESFEPKQMFEIIQDHKISVLFCVPTAFRMMLGVQGAEKTYDCSSLRICQSAGEWLPGITVREWKKRFGMPIIDSVGSGDLNYWLTTTLDTPDEKLDSSGKPFPGVECKVVDELFNDAPVCTEGELLVRAPWGQQYWRRPDKQKEGVVRGWNRPGLIYMEDKDGYFWYRGRNDEMIVSGGYKIPGGEVEAALLQHPAVIECAVIAAPDEVRGNIVKAFVILREGYSGSEELAAEMRDFVKQKIEVYKNPRAIEFVQTHELPRTITGKIQRFALRELEKAKCKEVNQNSNFCLEPKEVRNVC